MRVLVACEFSGAVRAALRHRGHDAWSADLLPAEDGSPYHFTGDVTAHVEGREARVHRAPPGPDRWKLRSRTLPGVAAAMADQWTTDREGGIDQWNW